MVINCDTCLHKNICDLWNANECQDASCYSNECYTPAAYVDAVKVVYCRDCKYKPHVKSEYKDRKPKYPFIVPGGFEIEFPDDENNPCPYCGGSDQYNNIMPDDDFFCAYGKKMDGE